MNDTSIINKIKIIYLLLPLYAVLTSSLYLLGYWSVFHINIFEYISLNEVIKLSVYPLGSYLFFSFILGFILYFLTPLQPQILDADFYNDLIPSKKIIFKAAIILYILIVLSVGIFSNLSYKWLLVGILLLGIAFPSLISFTKLSSLVTPLTTFIIYIIAFSLTVSYGWGNLKARQIESMPLVTSINNTPSQKILVGRTDKYVFLIPLNTEKNTHKNLEIISTDSIKKIRYRL